MTERNPGFMTHPEEARCETCPYWNRTINHGVCRRHAPRANDISGWAAWPATRADDWCGEHPAFAALRGGTNEGLTEGA